VVGSFAAPSPPSGRPTAATVDLDALAANFARLRQCAGGREVIAVVKADAYGHGAVPVARRLLAEGCAMLAVLSVAEAAALRAADIGARLLVLGGVHDPEEAAAALAADTTPVLHAVEQVAWLARAARGRPAPAPVHVEVDTGMRRMGVPPQEAAELLARVASADGLRLEGVSTHFARADETDPEPSREQLRCFRQVLAAARARGVEAPRVHVANSAGVLAAAGWGEEMMEGDAVRPGLALYGVAPAPHLADPALCPVMTLRTRVAALRRVEAGDRVGYGATWGAPHAGFVATLPAGYADGVAWSAGNRGSAVVAGRRVPIAGRVSMDFVTVWLGDEPVAPGAEAILFGVGAGGRLPVEEAAAAAGTIPYELLVRVGARVPRVVVGES
jgi:alanine racemase